MKLSELPILPHEDIQVKDKARELAREKHLSFQDAYNVLLLEWATSKGYQVEEDILG